jgi:autotransporter strand-loop-strand O-heptosyltransferase
MKKLKIFTHGSYIGNTGYNHHTRDFFRGLTNFCKIKVRNFTVGKTWGGMSEEPHNLEPYVNDVDKEILYEQILWDSDGGRGNFKIYENPDKEFNHDVNLVLCETNHHLFYDEYSGPKIAYNVWESTLQPKDFFKKLEEFDQLWVPSKWQKECTVKQGYDESKIRVVPEGVDIQTFKPENKKQYHPLTSDGRFKFFLAGRWDYRKSTKEIVESFLNTFDKSEPVDLIVSIDNPFSNDTFETTEQRLEHYGLTDDRIKVLHFPPRDEYVNLLKSCDVFVSCARSEGWNLPLIESMSCGTPSIYSNCSGQLEFAEGKGIPVNILGEKPVDSSHYNHFNESVGNYYEPDFNHLGKQMRKVFKNYEEYKVKSINESQIIRDNFNWETVSEIGFNTLSDFIKNKPKESDKNEIKVSYIDGPKVEVIGNYNGSYYVEFIDGDGVVKHSGTISNNMWISPSIKYYIPWTIKVNGVVIDKFTLKGKRVLIALESKSLGDTVAWAPYSIELSKQKDCKVILSTFHNQWFEKQPEYSNIEFISPGQSTICDVVYRVGWFYDENKEPELSNTIPLQQTITNIIGLDFKEIQSKIDFTPKDRPFKGKYVTLCNESTAHLKLWNNENGWKELTKYLISMGYGVVNVSMKGEHIDGTFKINDTSIPSTLNYIHHSEFFIGLSSGLSWLSWGIGKHVVMISNFTEEGHEFRSNCTRITNTKVCNGCWNNPDLKFDKGDWFWCPLMKGTEREFECHKSITSDMVINKIKHLIK